MTPCGAAFTPMKANTGDDAQLGDGNVFTVDDVNRLAKEADICAHSESCSLEDAEEYFNKLSSISNSRAVSLEADDAQFLSTVLVDLTLKMNP